MVLEGGNRWRGARIIHAGGDNHIPRLWIIRQKLGCYPSSSRGPNRPAAEGSRTGPSSCRDQTIGLRLAPQNARPQRNEEPQSRHTAAAGSHVPSPPGRKHDLKTQAPRVQPCGTASHHPAHLVLGTSRSLSRTSAPALQQAASLGHSRSSQVSGLRSESRPHAGTDTAPPGRRPESVTVSTSSSSPGQSVPDHRPG